MELHERLVKEHPFMQTARVVSLGATFLVCAWLFFQVMHGNIFKT